MRKLLLLLLLLCLSCAKQPQAQRAGGVVAMAPNLAEIAAFVGYKDELRLRCNYSDYPAWLEELPSVGSCLSPNIEMLISAKLDRVFLPESFREGSVARHLAKAGVSLHFFEVESPRDVLLTAKEMASFRKQGQGQKLSSLENSLSPKTPLSASNIAPRVALVQGRRPLVLAGPGSYGESILFLAGGVNAVKKGPPYVNVDFEELLALEADCVIDCSAAFSQGRLFGARKPRLIEFSHGGILRPGPRFPGAISALREKLETCIPKGVQDD